MGILTSRRCLVALCVLVLSSVQARGLETDQYFTWGMPLEDATDIVNRKVNLEIANSLARVNARRSWREMSCHTTAKSIASHFRMFLFHDIEIWASQSSLVPHIPDGYDEDTRYRDEYIYRNTHFFDVGTKVPPSATIKVNDVRFGADKLSHFFSEGWLYYNWYHRSRSKGLSAERALHRAMRKGYLFERSILGLMASGVFSIGDLEANFRGMQFYRSLCESNRLVKTESGWKLRDRFDFREYITPEWDESYLPNVFSRRRWKKVRPVLLNYCRMLDNPDVQRERREYRARDRETETERWLRPYIDAGKLKDPEQFGLDANCPP